MKNPNTPVIDALKDTGYRVNFLCVAPFALFFRCREYKFISGDRIVGIEVGSYLYRLLNESNHVMPLIFSYN